MPARSRRACKCYVEYLARCCAPAGDVFEQGVLLSVKQKDEASFERNYQQLKVFYTDARRGSEAAAPAPARRGARAQAAARGGAGTCWRSPPMRS